MYSREHDGEEIHFGNTGYTMDSVFVLYDRQTESVWYPLKRGRMNAVSGPRKGDTIPILDKPKVVTLAKWLKKHPDSQVLMPTPQSKTVHDISGVMQGPRFNRGPRWSVPVSLPDKLGPAR